MAIHPLGLKPMEWKAIRDCMWAREVCPSGNFLPASRNMAAAGRMAERGFLTELTEEQKSFVPPIPEWRVFKITDENIQLYNAALIALDINKEEPRP